MDGWTAVLFDSEFLQHWLVKCFAASDVLLRNTYIVRRKNKMSKC